MNWFCVYVRLCDVLLMLQDSPAPAAAGGAESPVATAPAPAAAAAEGTAEALQNAANAAKDAPPPWMQFMPFIAIGLFFYFILLRPQQAEQRRKKELLASLKKNDKVVTTSGMIGTIADISSDGTRVTLRVDDNTRIKFLRSAIQEPLKDSPDSNGSGSV
ncbi:MAG: preprotein translocase subunit YajC [Planctomycetaceae bacterium]